MILKLLIQELRFSKVQIMIIYLTQEFIFNCIHITIDAITCRTVIKERRFTVTCLRQEDSQSHVYGLIHLLVFTLFFLVFVCNIIQLVYSIFHVDRVSYLFPVVFELFLLLSNCYKIQAACWKHTTLLVPIFHTAVISFH